jgi:hypothetical protein
MGDNNRKLEEFFQNQYNDPEKYKNQDEWSIPPKEAWTNIKDALNENRDKLPPFFYSGKGLALLLIGVLIILFLGYNYKVEKVKNQNLKEELKSTQQIITDLLTDPESGAINQLDVNDNRSSIKFQSINNLSEENIVSRENKDEIEELNKQDFIAESEIIKNRNGNTSKIDRQLTTSTSSQYESALLEGQKGTKLNTQLKVNSLDKSPYEINDVAKNELMMLDRSTIQALPTEFALLNDPVALPIEYVESKSKLYVGLEVGKLFKINERPNDFRGMSFPDNSFAFENRFNSQNLGIKIGYQILPNLTIESGLNYIKSSVNINHKRLITLSNLREFLDMNGNFIGGFNFDIPTSTGSIGTDVISSRSSSSNLDPKEAIDIGIIIDHNFHQLSLPLVVRYTKKFGPITTALRTGIVNTWNLSNGIIVNDIQSSKKDFIFWSTSDQIGNNQNRLPASYRLNYLVGLALEFELSDDLRLYVEPSYTQSTSSLINNGRFKAFNKQVSINTGVKKLF